ncbi:MAG TPA: NTP transferase domain-containing protein [Acholeplasmataceae bacterium]|jgi:bifunctional UDP-N-acetylglucosamine pyrophosphorylase/glucosamine-1-phosphate N-acetyltransferase|nr:NTP transferase domain-containing protein [Acholeplasmataceae bacterium]
MEIYAIVLAAGKGTRMKSEQPKCAHKIIDKPMVEYVVDTLKDLKIKNIITVVGYGKEKIIDLLKGKTEFVVQEKQLGTAHAVKQAKPLLEGKEGITIIAIGDMPFIKRETFYSLIINHMQEQADLTVLTVEHPQPYGYGRILRDENGNVIRIIEERDCTKEQSAIREINSSVYAVNNELLFDALDEIKNTNVQNEYYLTDLVNVFNKRGYKVNGYKSNDYNEISGINDKLQLVVMEREFQNKIIEKHLLNGVTIHRPETVVIGKDVKIYPGATILPNTHVLGNSVIEKNSTIGPNSLIENSTVGEEAIVEFAIVKNKVLKEQEHIKPFTILD